MYRHEKNYTRGSMVRTTVACSYCHEKAGTEAAVGNATIHFRNRRVLHASTLMKHRT